ncbi:putative beta-glucosidase precursor [Cantharellus anzutake]|uniref:putative beta-glucosidase precursor n=1 Tax=Cantharellus anzutake TaxID=1750568 RepID=UPI0019087E76|nr:putative beta-glucosidase precursor [Cantharellus anzutake]KAF8325853.1 putative beta-glucosidase precursor [Cantharellus anzutake]
MTISSDNHPARPFHEFGIEETISKLTDEEKVLILSGRDMWHTAPITRIGIPALRVSDGPNGVRGTKFFEGVPASCFPAATGLGASWDRKFLYLVGRALGVESKSKGVHVLLAPTINIQRSPLGGRGFESYSEDPFLSGSLARAYIEGVQSEGIAATVKHYVANEQEFERMTMSSDMSMRTLREIYLRAFELVIRAPNPPWAIMTGYNRVNGVYCCDNLFLISTVLRGEWGFKGLVMSDWYGTYSIAESIRAGLDLEMPGPARVRGAALATALRDGKVSQKDIDDRVRNVLNLINNVQPSGVPEDAPEKSNDDPDAKKLLREAASSAIVLLKNEVNLLPLDPSVIKSISVIGPNAKSAAISGGGSAALRPSYTVTPFDAIAEAAKELGINEVKYARGGNAHNYAPIPGPELRAADGTVGVDLTFYNENPLENRQAEPVFHMVATTTCMFMADNLPHHIINPHCWLEARGKFTPEATSEYEFGVSASGKADLYIDGRRVVDNSANPKPGDTFFGTGSKEQLGRIKLEAGRSYDLLVRYTYDPTSTEISAPTSRGGLRFGVSQIRPTEEFIGEAVAVAKQVDAVVLVIGLNSDELAAAVLTANENTVVVVQSGTPVEMPWVDKATSLLQAFYGGNEAGRGISDVLFGKVNPSGRLPLSFPIRVEDNPSYPNFGGENGHVYYGEDVFVGYRHYEAVEKKVLFPFGFGKSYTTFGYSDVSVSSTKFGPEDTVTVSVKVTNTGNRGGREVVQVYVHDVVSTLQRPPKELKGFAKTAVLQPGESEDVSIVLDHLAFGFFKDHEQVNRWVAEKGEFEVFVGSTLKDIRASFSLELTETFFWV